MSFRGLILLLLIHTCEHVALGADSQPNIFIAISDDQSWPHTSAYGSKMVDTPAFDRIAREGVLFTQAFCASPGCSPSRAALLTGQNCWQLEHAGTHGSYFDPKYETFPERLAASGYFVGCTGKGWGPGDFKHLGRTDNPAGKIYKASKNNGDGPGYIDGLKKFLRERPAGQPFCYWFGSHDPHREYTPGSGLAKGKRMEDAEVPPFLPDTPEIRSDLLDYAYEIERFDSDLQKMLTVLEQEGLLDNTLVIVTSDNGMPFPRAKANCYEYGIHMPLAIRWGKQKSPGRVIDELVGFTDLTATIYEITGARPPQSYPLMGNSIANILKADQQGSVERERTAIFAARERHSSSRYNTLGYPQRAVRTDQYLYIYNFKPERWPAGPGQKFAAVTYSDNGSILKSTLGSPHMGYHDIDACPTLSYLIDHQGEPEIKRFFDLAVAKRPAEELFDVAEDPGCLRNLAGNQLFEAVKTRLRERLMEYLRETDDPRVIGDGDVWETYPRVSKMRWFPKSDWAKEYPDSIPEQPWVEALRPK